MKRNTVLKRNLSILIVLLLTALLSLGSVTIYFNFIRGKGLGDPGDGLSWSVDAWDGESSDDAHFIYDFANRGDDTITIDSAESFMHFIEMVNSGESYSDTIIYLNKSIDFKGQTIPSIGNETHPFEGIFDGGYYTLMNVKINGNGLFGATQGATIQNVGLYNVDINSTSYAGGLVGNADNTEVINSFVRKGKLSADTVGGLVGKGTNVTIESSFSDIKLIGKIVGGLVGEAYSDMYINESYYNSVKSVGNSEETFPNVVNVKNDADFSSWTYESDYSLDVKWCDFNRVGDTYDLDFDYPILSAFAKVYLKGAFYEGTIKIGNDIYDTSSISDALSRVNTGDSAEITLIVDEISSDETAVIKGDVTIKLAKDVTITRGVSNTSAMFYTTDGGELTVGYEGNDALTLTIDGNREYVEKNGLTSGPVMVGKLNLYNVTIQNNTNNLKNNSPSASPMSIRPMDDFSGETFSGSGGGVTVFSTSTFTNCSFENCSADYNGGGLVSQHSNYTTLNNVTFTGCTASNSGGAIYATSSLRYNGGSITNCSAGNHGDGIYCYSNFDVYTNYSVDISCSGEAIYLHGGNILDSDGGLSINSGSITIGGSGIELKGISDVDCIEFDGGAQYYVDSDTPLVTGLSGIGVAQETITSGSTTYYLCSGALLNSSGIYGTGWSESSYYLRSSSLLVEDPVAMIGTTGYASFNDALTAAKSGKGNTIMICKDVSGNYTIPCDLTLVAYSSNVTIDGSLTLTADLTLGEGSDSGDITVTGSIRDGGNAVDITINQGSVRSINSTYEESNITINNGSIDSISTAGALTISGGSISDTIDLNYYGVTFTSGISGSYTVDIGGVSSGTPITCEGMTVGLDLEITNYSSYVGGDAIAYFVSNDSGDRGENITLSGNNNDYKLVNGSDENFGIEDSYAYIISVPTYTVSISVNDSEWGSVSGESEYSIKEGNTIIYSNGKIYISNDESGITLNVTPTASNYEYTYSISSINVDETDLGWTNDIFAGGTHHIENNLIIYVTFSRKETEHTLSVSASTGGSVNKSNVTIYYNDEITLDSNGIASVSRNSTFISTISATASDGYVFDYWTINGSTVSGTTPLSNYIDSVGDTVTIKANFVQEYTVYFEVDDSSAGYVDKTSIRVKAGTTFSSSGSTMTFSDGQTVTAYANSNSQQYFYYFVGWSRNSGTITMNNSTILASIAQSLMYYYITFEASSSDYGRFVGSNEFPVTWGTTYSTNGNEFIIGDNSEVNAGYVVVALPKTSTDEYTYSFSHWSSNSGTITGDTTITAYFTATKNTYTVTWKNFGGAVLDTDEVEYGDTPVYNGATPQYAGDAQFSYKFIGWTPTISPVTGDQTYTATYEAITNSYTITWVDGDGKTLDTDIVSYGNTPSYSGPTPTKTKTTQFTYTWTGGWTPSISAVTGNQTYTATFTSTTNKYTITWNNHDGTTLKTDQVAYGSTPSYTGTTPTKTSTAQYSYTHSGWTPTIVPVDGAKTYTATFTSTVRTYPITWKDYNGTVLRTDTVAYGNTPSYGSTPTRASIAQYTYTFKGWDPTITSVTGEATYTAQYTETPVSYKITYVPNGGSSTPNTQTVEYNKSTTLASAIAREGYTFAGWKADSDSKTYNAGASFTMPAKDVTMTAQWSINSYKITYVPNGGSSTPSTQTVEYNKSTTLASAIAREGYTFAGWKADSDSNTYSAGATFTMPAKDVTMTAQWSINSYEITYLPNGGSTTPNTQTVEYNKSTTLASAITRTGCTFTGWLSSSDSKTYSAGATFTMPAKDVTMTAQWSTDTYTIAFDKNGGSGSTASVIATYNQSVKLTDNGFTRTGYTFSGWATSSTGAKAHEDKATLTATQVNTYYSTAGKGATYTLYAVWTPNPNTKYTVNHYQENLYNTATTLSTSNCTLVINDTENLTGTTASSVTPAVKSYTGFISPSTQTVTIAADGSTVVNYFYTRNTYTMTVQSSNAEYGKVNNTAKVEYTVDYGTPYTVSGNEVTFKNSSGTSVTVSASFNAQNNEYIYSFDGWSQTSGTVTENTTITANFSRTDRLYNVTLAVNNSSYGSVNPTSVQVKYNSTVSTNNNILTIADKTITATAKTKTTTKYYKFVNWTGVVSKIVENTTITANFEELTIVDLPTQIGTLTYTGGTLSPTWSSTTGLDVSGEISGVNAYIYTATFTPQSGYCWSDGTNGSKDKEWTISQATGYITVEPTSVNKAYPNAAITTITSHHGGEISYTIDPQIATVSIVGSAVTVTPIATGTTVVTLTCAATQNYTQATATFTVTFEEGGISHEVKGYEGTYDGEPHSIVVTVTDSAITDYKITYSTSKLGDYTTTNPTYTDAREGGYTVYYEITASGYKEASGSAKVIIHKATIDATVSMSNYTYGDTVPTPSVSVNPGNGNVTYYYNTTGLNNGGTEWKNITPTTLNAGTYYMYAVIGETTNYQAYTTAAVQFEVFKAQSSLSISNLDSNITYGDTIYGTITYTGDGEVSVVSSDNTKVRATYSNNTITLLAIGHTSDTIIITVSASEGTNYKAPTSVTHDITILKRDITFTSAGDSKVYNSTALTKHEANITTGSLARYESVSDVVTYDFTGTITNVGSVDNTFSVVNIKHRNTDVTDCYNITYVYGKLTITVATVTIPTASETTFTYDGGLKALNISNYDENVMNREGTYSETNAGEYTVTFDLKDKTNYTWSDGTIEAVKIDWNIKKAEVTCPSSPEPKEYTGRQMSHGITLPTGVEAISGTEGTNVDTYYLVLKLQDNYIWSDGTTDNKTVEWNIVAKKIDKPTASVTKFKYDGTPKTPAISNDYNEDIMDKTGDVSKTDAGNNYKLLIRLTNDNYTWTTGGTEDVEIYWSIEKATVALPEQNNTEFTYDGTEQTYEPANWDDIKELVNIDNNTRTNQGTQQVSFTLQDTTNYEWDGVITTHTFTINKATITIAITPATLQMNYGNTVEFTHTVEGLIGNDKLGGEAIYQLFDKNDDEVSISNISTLAEGDYTIKVSGFTTPSDNYELKYIDGKLTIGIVTVALPVASTLEYIYNGVEQEYIPDNWAEIKDYLIISGHRQTNADDYTITFELNDKTNFKWVDNTTTNKTLSWTIEQAKVSLPNAPEDKTYTGDTFNHGVAIPEGAIPEDGCDIEASDVGIYELVLTLKNKNYIWDDVNDPTGDKTIIWKIVTAKVTIPTANTEIFTYNGGEQTYLPDNWVALEQYVDIHENTKIDADEYTVTFTLKDTTNYEWDGVITTHKFTISKATINITAEDKVMSYGGSVTFTYSVDGLYPNDTISGEAKYKVYNQGNIVDDISSLPEGEYDIEVSGLTASNNYIVEFIYGTLTVGTATVSLPDIPDRDKTFTYDGNEHSPFEDSYTGLSMTGDIAKTDAGNYTATFTPDTGYVWDDGHIGDKTISWIIKPQSIEKPTISITTFEYSKDTKTLEISKFDDTIITMSGEVSGTEAKEYTVSFELINNKNYIWNDNTTTKYDITWTITTKKISVPTENKTKFTYNGTVQTYEPENWGDIRDYVIISNNTRKEVGSQEVNFELNNPNYEWNGTLGKHEFIIAKKSLTIKVIDKNMDYKGTIPTFDYSAEGLVAGDSLGTPTYVVTNVNGVDVTSILETQPAGTYTIVVNGLSNENYDITRNSGTLTINGTTYYVAFDANGGEGTVDRVKIVVGADYTLSNDVFTRDNYVFVAWNTKADATGDNYYVGDKINFDAKVDEVITLYATWAEDKDNDGIRDDAEITVTFKIVNGKWKDNKTDDITVTLTLLKDNRPSSDGVAYLRVSDIPTDMKANEDCYGGSWSNNMIPTISLEIIEDTTFTYSFTAMLSVSYKSFTAGHKVDENVKAGTKIIINPNGGKWEGSASEQEIIISKDTEISDVPDTSNRVFVGWNIVKDEGTITLTAQFAKRYYIIFNSNNGEGTMDSQEVISEDEVELDDNKFKRTGYRFKGWNTKADGTGTHYKNKALVSKLTEEDSITLYALWEKDMTGTIIIIVLGISIPTIFMICFIAIAVVRKKKSERANRASAWKVN